MIDTPFTYNEALALWSRLVAGWAHSLDSSGARTWIDGVTNEADSGGSYEGVTRMLWGLGAWLSQPARPVVLRWHGATFDTLALTRQALIGGTSPESPGYWGSWPARGEYDQRTVESGQVAFATWQTRERIWAHLSEAERANLIAWLDRFGKQPSIWRNNWALFWVLNHASRKALGAPYDQQVIDSALDYLEGVYCGDGWYDDGAERGANHFDDYNSWVFSTHVLAWMQCDGHTQPERRERLLDRVRQYMAHVPYFYGASGAYSEYGRSLSYKFARLGGPLWAYKLGAWPHPVGMLRRMVGRHIRWYVNRGAVRPDGTLRQALTSEGSVEVREPYIATGSTYWAMLAFAGLWSLPDDDPFWTAEEQPLPVEQGDFVKVFQQPGWVVAGTQASGAVQRFNGRSYGYPAKYAKFVYSSAAPFNAGLADGMPAPDAMLCLTDGQQYGHRIDNQAAAVGDPGWLRMRYTQQIGGGQHTIDTTLIVLGESHIRAHRISLDPGSNTAIGAVEGSAPLGYAAGMLPLAESNEASGWELALVGERTSQLGRAVAIRRLRGYDGQRRAATWLGRGDLNSVYGHYLLPLLSVSRLEREHELICLAFSGTAEHVRDALQLEVREAIWRPGGQFYLALADGRSWEVPPL